MRRGRERREWNDCREDSERRFREKIPRRMECLHHKEFRVICSGVRWQKRVCGHLWGGSDPWVCVRDSFLFFLHLLKVGLSGGSLLLKRRVCALLERSVWHLGNSLDEVIKGKCLAGRERLHGDSLEPWHELLERAIHSLESENGRCVSLACDWRVIGV